MINHDIEILVFSREAVQEFVTDNPFHHGGTKYPIAPFHLELLMGFYVNKFNVPHVTITPNVAMVLKSWMHLSQSPIANVWMGVPIRLAMTRADSWLPGLGNEGSSPATRIASNLPRRSASHLASSQ